MCSSVLCETVRDLIARVGPPAGDASPAVGRKCEVLNEKLSLLMAALKEEDPTVPASASSSSSKRTRTVPASSSAPVPASAPAPAAAPAAAPAPTPAPTPAVFTPRDTLMLRANSLKKAIREIMAHAEHTIDEQTARTAAAETEGKTETETKTETAATEWQVRTIRRDGMI